MEMESEGKSVTEAVEAALKKAGLRRDQVEVQILQEGSSGFMGFGAKPARVRITEKHWGEKKAAPAGLKAPIQPSSRPRRSGDYPPAAMPAREPAGRAEGRKESSRAPREAREKPPRETRRPREAAQRPAVPPPMTSVEAEAACAKASAAVGELLKLMLFEDARAQTRWDAEQERIQVSVETCEADRLIGPGGRTLESLQFLATLITVRRLGRSAAVQVDTKGYWAGREEEILALARKGVEEVRSTGKPYRLSPMDAQMRRLIHRSLAGHPDIVTASEGDGVWRKIVLRPKK